MYFAVNPLPDINSTSLLAASTLQYCTRHFGILKPCNLLSACATHQGLSEPMLKFRDYLQKKGSRMANNEDFIPYFALPHVHSPWEHSLFKHLFDDDWKATLKKDIMELMQSIPEDPAIPKLYQVLDKYNNHCKSQLARVFSTCSKLFTRSSE